MRDTKHEDNQDCQDNADNDQSRQLDIAFQLFFFQSYFVDIVFGLYLLHLFIENSRFDGVFQVECPDIQRKSFRTPPGFYQKIGFGQLLVDIIAVPVFL